MQSFIQIYYSEQIIVVILSPPPSRRINSAKNLAECGTFGLNTRSFTEFILSAAEGFRMTRV